MSGVQRARAKAPSPVRLCAVAVVCAISAALLSGCQAAADAPTPGASSPERAPSEPSRAPSVQSTPLARVGTSVPGVALTALVRSDGSFDVVERVRLPEPRESIVIAPVDPRPLGSALSEVTPLVVDLGVWAGDEAVPTPSRTLSVPLRQRFRAPTTDVELRYLVTGVSRLSAPAPPGRALGALAPLLTAANGDLPVAVRVRGRATRNLRCAELPLAEQACAVGSAPDVWVGRLLPLGRAGVVVQLDLPRR